MTKPAESIAKTAELGDVRAPAAFCLITTK